MLYTELMQRCYSINPTPTTIEFRIETTVEAAGELPRKDIFVYNAPVADDPSADYFSHVASVAELQTLPPDRDDAIAAGGAYYLDLYMEKKYDDLEVAVAAKPTIISRVNDLVNAWVTYRDTFYADSGEIIYCPSADQAELDARKVTYEEAKKEREAAELVATEANAAVTAAEEELAKSQEILAIYQNDKAFALSVLQGNYPTYISLVLTGLGESTAANTYRTTPVTGLDALINTQVNYYTAQVTVWTNTVTTNQVALATATTSKIKADAALETAVEAEDKALAEVIDLCQDFDPNA